MERSGPSLPTPARWALGLLALAGCASPPPPAVDEERIARRVVALLRREGLVLRGARDGGVREGDPARDDAAEEAGDEARDEGADGDEEAAADDEPGVDPRAAAAVATRVRAAPGAARRPGRPRPTVTAAAPAQPVTAGDGDAARTWFPLDGAPAVGPADALVTVVAFLDTECPFSARLHPMLREMQREHAAELRLVVRHLPLQYHQAAWGGAVFAEFARAEGGDAGFFAALDRLYAHPRELDRASLDRHAAALGLDPLRLADALDAPAPTALDRRVAADDALASAGHVVATPTMYFNGHHVAGALPREVLERHFEFERDRARRALARGARRPSLYDALARAPDPGYQPAAPRRNPRAP